MSELLCCLFHTVVKTSSGAASGVISRSNFMSSMSTKNLGFPTNNFILFQNLRWTTQLQITRTVVFRPAYKMFHTHTHMHTHTHIHIVTLHYIYMHAEKMSWGERDWDSIALDPPTADDSHSCQMVLRETLKPKRMAATTPPGSQWPDSVVSIEFRELSFIRNCDWNSPTCVETLGCAKMNCFLFNFGETRLVNTYHEMPP